MTPVALHFNFSASMWNATMPRWNWSQDVLLIYFEEIFWRCIAACRHLFCQRPNSPIGPQRPLSFLSLHYSNQELAMTGKATLDNTLGAVFLGITASCAWVIHDEFAKHPDTLPSYNQSHRHRHGSNTFILPELSQRLDIPESHGEGCWKYQSEGNPDVITRSRLGPSCRHNLYGCSSWGVIIFISL